MLDGNRSEAKNSNQNSIYSEMILFNSLVLTVNSQLDTRSTLRVDNCPNHLTSVSRRHI